MVGNQTTLSIHSSHTARKPMSLPKASVTHAYTPPFLGQPAANSAQTKATGIKKQRPAAIKKVMAWLPKSAVVGRFLRLTIAETLNMAKVKTPKNFLGRRVVGLFTMLILFKYLKVKSKGDLITY